MGKENQQLSRQLDEIKQGDIFFFQCLFPCCLCLYLFLISCWKLLLNFRGVY